MILVGTQSKLVSFSSGTVLPEKNTNMWKSKKAAAYWEWTLHLDITISLSLYIYISDPDKPHGETDCWGLNFQFCNF